jgi:hypothetical protein
LRQTVVGSHPGQASPRVSFLDHEEALEAVGLSE